MHISGKLNYGISPWWPVVGVFASQTSSSHLRNWSRFQLCIQTGLGTASCRETSFRRLLYSSVSMHCRHVISKYVFLAPTILFISVSLFNYELCLGSLLLSQPKHAQCQINLFFFFLYIIILPNQGWLRLSLYLKLVPSP
uniref:Uncharacterized protein n=1 Tax=Pipistrellus kuhlii TaxID=59472 RepID=A0A7J7XV20_PIPKU|nr:hypothetical protein mPipKuh1_010484 [Pipistrellus kuhlii]